MTIFVIYVWYITFRFSTTCFKIRDNVSLTKPNYMTSVFTTYIFELLAILKQTQLLCSSSLVSSSPRISHMFVSWTCQHPKETKVDEHSKFTKLKSTLFMLNRFKFFTIGVMCQKFWTDTLLEPNDFVYRGDAFTFPSWICGFRQNFVGICKFREVLNASSRYNLYNRNICCSYYVTMKNIFLTDKILQCANYVIKNIHYLSHIIHSFKFWKQPNLIYIIFIWCCKIFKIYQFIYRIYHLIFRLVVIWLSCHMFCI